MMKCVICDANSSIIFNKGGYDYHQCEHCQTVFIPGGLPQGGKVGGEHEVGRNEKENHIRIGRILELVGKYGKIWDFASGHGYLVRDCKAAGLDAVGYDKFNPECDKIPEGQFNICTMIEIIEHTTSPFEELDIIYNKVLPGGVVMIESSYVDVAAEENIPLNSFFYLNVENGHCTMFSHYGLDLLMKKKGFSVCNPINRNVRIYVKKGK